MKKIIGAIIVIVLIAGGAYMYLRFHVLKAKDYKPVVAKEKNMVDLRPAIIAKLQQLVKDGSDSLYRLNIDSIEPDVINAKVYIRNASISVDTPSLNILDKAHKLPDDIFKIKLNAFYVNHFGIEDLLHKNRINVGDIIFSKPTVNIYHHLRAYNAEERKENSKKSLYQRLLGNIKSIGIAKIQIDHGTFIIHQFDKKANNTKLNDVSVSLSKILIDSSTQFDKNRFLFAKTASFSAKNYALPTPDSLYVFSVGAIAISADQHTLIADNVRLKAKGGKEGFMKRIKSRKEMYDISVPKISLKGVNWRAILNNEKWLSSEANLFSPLIYVYMDPRLPVPKNIHLNNFPHQVLLRSPLPISVSRITFRNFKVSYEEFNPKINRSGTVHFDRINGSITYASNIPSEIKNHPIAYANAKGWFMNATPAIARFQFFMNKPETGDFKLDIDVDTLKNNTINLVSEPLALFNIKRGEFIHGTAHVEGNNTTTHDNLAVEYRNLHITPLKADSNDEGKLKKKAITSFFANKILIKDNNPGGNGELRKPSYSVDRDHHGNFFNFIWLSVMTGVLKTIGIPVKLIIK
ncbi:MAG: hypothetical protein NVS3B19_08080 [Ginsengibacter sp.]